MSYVLEPGPRKAPFHLTIASIILARETKLDTKCGTQQLLYIE